MISIITFFIIVAMFYVIFYVFGFPITERIRKKETFNKLHGNAKIPLNPNFQQIYEKICSDPVYIEINNYRSSAEKKLLLGLIPFFLLFLGTLTFAGLKIGFLITYIVILFLYLTIIFYPVYNQFKTLYKNNVILPLIENISSTLKYTHDDGSPTEEAYKASTLETGFYNKYSSDDYMYGSINGYNFNLTNVHTQHIKKSDIGKVITHLFNGIFIYSYTNSNIDFNFKILNKKFIYANPNFEITLLNTKFSNNFRLYSESSDGVLETLKPEILNLIINFTETYGVPFDLCVTNNAFYFRFYTGASFESHLFKKTNDLYSLNMYYSIINFSIDFIDTFKRYN